MTATLPVPAPESCPAPEQTTLPMPRPVAPATYTLEQVAALAQCGKRTITRREQEGKFPRRIPGMKRPRYPKKAVDACMAGGKVRV